MGKKSPPAGDFTIHVDPSCLTDSTDLEMPAERVASNETVVHHEPEPESELYEEQSEGKDEIQELLDELSQHGSSGEEYEEQVEEALENEKSAEEEIQPSDEQDIVEDANHNESEKDENEELHDTKDVEDSVETHEDEELENEDLQDNEALQDDEESHENEDLHEDEAALEDNQELHKDEDTQELHESEDLHQEEEHQDEELHRELQEDEEDHEDEELHEDEEDLRRRQERERREERAEALIHAAARAVVASIEQDSYNHDNEDSVLSTQTDESYDQSASELTYDEGTELTYEEGTEVTYDGTEATYESETEHHESENGGGDSSSHHDGDIDDDDVFSHNSGRSARSSLNSSDGLHSGEEAYQEKILTSPKVGEEVAPSEVMSRIPSAASFREKTPQTPGHSKVLSRPPFRTPSAVRAMQMSSPTPSLYATPRSAKRTTQGFNPTVSRLGTPSRRDSELSQSHFSPSSRHKTPTRVFKTKVEHPLVLLHVTVLPLQFPYADVMNLSEEEIPGVLFNLKESWRLLQDKCGEQVLARGILLPHPQDSYEILEERLLEALELPVRPRAKILKCGHYMGPDELTSSADDSGDDQDDWAVDRRDSKAWCDICSRNVQYDKGEFGATERKFRVKIYASNGLMRAGAWAAAWREMERVDVELEPFVESHLIPELERLQSEQIPVQEEPVEEENREPQETHEEKVLREHHAAEAEEATRKQVLEEEEARRQEEELQRMREIYEAANVRPASKSEPRRESRSRSRSPQHGESLPELLLAAFKIAVRDQKNILIGILSLVVLVLALRPRGGDATQLQSAHTRAPERVVEAAQPTIPEMIVKPSRMVADMPEKIEEVLDEMEIVPKVKRVFKSAEAPAKPLRKVAEIAEKDEEILEEVEVVPQIKRSVKSTEIPAKAKRAGKEAVAKPKPAVKKIEEPAPVRMEIGEEEEEEMGIEAFEIEEAEAEFDIGSVEPFDLEVMEEEEVQSVEQEHYHIEPPTQKKKKNPAALKKGVAPAQRGVEPVAGRRMK